METPKTRSERGSGAGFAEKQWRCCAYPLVITGMLPTKMCEVRSIEISSCHTRAIFGKWVAT
jgi:hypothetical protein